MHLVTWPDRRARPHRKKSAYLASCAMASVSGCCWEAAGGSVASSRRGSASTASCSAACSTAAGRRHGGGREQGGRVSGCRCGGGALSCLQRAAAVGWPPACRHATAASSAACPARAPATRPTCRVARQRRQQDRHQGQHAAPQAVGGVGRAVLPVSIAVVNHPAGWSSGGACPCRRCSAAQARVGVPSRWGLPHQVAALGDQQPLAAHRGWGEAAGQHERQGNSTGEQHRGLQCTGIIATQQASINPMHLPTAQHPFQAASSGRAGSSPQRQRVGHRPLLHQQFCAAPRLCQLKRQQQHSLLHTSGSQRAQHARRLLRLGLLRRRPQQGSTLQSSGVTGLQRLGSLKLGCKAHRE